MIRLFCGFDRREEPGLHVFISSVLRRASRPVNFIPLSSQGLSQGSNEFTLSRFLAARFCDFRGHAIFCDGSDMLVDDDIARLDALFDSRYAVQVVKHPDYESLHTHKYVGTELWTEQSNYSRKNWASVMLINCEHPDWMALTCALNSTKKLDVLQFRFLQDEAIGELPAKWNVLVDEGQEARDASILHWTAGIPHFAHYKDAAHSARWFEARDFAWQEGRVG